MDKVVAEISEITRYSPQWIREVRKQVADRREARKFVAQARENGTMSEEEAAELLNRSTPR